ncbi:MAG: glycosyltransferase [Crocinitomicaceae bacterium]|nr:glycosyltransferase [Crocinitomicaceae bacterium]
MLVSRFPFPLDKGDKLRAYYQLKELSASYDITLVALSDKKIPEKHIEQISQFCQNVHVCHLTWFSRLLGMMRCVFNNRPFQTGYFYNIQTQRRIKSLIQQNNFKHIFCQLIRTTEYVKNVHNIPKTLDYMDALSAGIRRRIDQQPLYKKWLFRMESRRLIKYEQYIFDYFENKVIISEQDRKLIHHPEQDKIECIPNGIDSAFFDTVEGTQDHTFVFVGNMSYPPNIDAVHFIAEKILPKFKDSTLLISGSSPSSSVQQLAANSDNITLTGWVDDIRTSYIRGKIFLAPMMIGTGMQNKLLEAMAMKTPCVTTPLANNAIKATHGKEVLVGSTTEELIDSIQRLMDDPSFSKELAINASKYVQNNYSWDTSVDQLNDLFKADMFSDK